MGRSGILLLFLGVACLHFIPLQIVTSDEQR